MRAMLPPAILHGQKNGGRSHDQGLQHIVTKLGIPTPGKVLGVLQGILVLETSARRRYRSEKNTFFAPGEKWTNLIVTKKYSKNRRHPYAQFGVEIMLISLYLANIWPKKPF